MESGVYQIRNLVNGKCYVGSSKNLKRRKKEHFVYLKKGKNPKENKHLQNAYNKYGAENFTFEILEYCDENILISREQYYIDSLKSSDSTFGYNIRKIADSNFGVPCPEETKKILSELNSGENHPQFGKPKAEKTKSLLSKANMGKVSPWKGKKHTEGTKQKLSFAHTGKKHTEETKQKLSIAHTGKKHTEEHKRHTSEAKKQRDLENLLRTIAYA
jgi:group I intron endonuclease